MCYFFFLLTLLKTTYITKDGIYDLYFKAFILFRSKLCYTINKVIANSCTELNSAFSQIQKNSS
jgi:hypothetical protein